MKARLVNGSPLMVDHTPSGAALAAGDVVVQVDHVKVAHNDIADGQLGALAAGGAVYRVQKEAALAINAGDKLYWDTVNNNVDKTNTNKPFGFALKAALAADTHVEAVHWPF